MKLIKQQTLYFKGDNSDKVYEVDLCEVDKNKFVVNFRYGRRGTTLKDGTKTILPVSQAEAEKIYTALLAEKTKKGYQDSVEAFTGMGKKTGSSTTAGKFDLESKRYYLISQINSIAELAAAGKFKADEQKQRRFRHMVINAGALGLAEVESALLKCLGCGTPLLDYAIAHALGRLSRYKAQSIPALVKLYQKSSTPEYVKNMAVEAMQRISDAPGDYKAHLAAALPAALRFLVDGEASALYDALKTQLNPKAPQSYDVLYTLYQIDNPACRQALLRLLAEAPLLPPWFRQVRAIFKAAEYRQDAEFYALLAYRFGATRAMWDNKRYRGFHHNGKYYNKLAIKQSLANGEGLFAYSSLTRLYLRRRIVRNLRHLGENQAPEYIKLASAILASFKDADGGKPVTVSLDHWRYDREARRSYRETRCTYYDSFAHYLDFGFILYRNSPRYLLKNRTYRCKPGYEPGKPVPQEREEAFPGLWDKHFRAIPALLGRSQCERVHQFGVKVLKNNPEFLARPTKEEAIILLKSPYLVSAELAMAIIDKVLLQYPADNALICSLLVSVCSQARQKGMLLLEKHPNLATNELLLELLFAPFRDMRQYLQVFLSRFLLPEAQAKAYVGQIIARLVLTTAPAKQQQQAVKEQLEDITQLLLKQFKKLCAELSESILLDLIDHPVEQVQALGAEILLIHNRYAASPPDRIIQKMLKSPFPSVMGLGVKLFGQLPDIELLTKELALKEFLLHPLAEVQQQARPIIRKLVALSAEFAGSFLATLLSHLFRLKDEDKIRYLTLVIREDFQSVKTLPMLLIRQMLHSRETAIQELGGHFLANPALLAQLTSGELLLLADKDALNVRSIARQWCETHLGELKQHMEAAVKLLDAGWDDTREFAFKLFATRFTRADFTPLALVGICDSTREDVQQFGKKLIMLHFQESDGADYLVKLSEHPARGIQFFVTNLLEKYAAGSPARLSSLTDYMRRVLLSVNKASAAKERILRFIGQEAGKDRETAACLAPLLAGLAHTIAVTYRDQALGILTQIHNLYPDIPVPVKTIEPEVRNAV